MIPSLLLLFLPPWLFFTVFKGMFLLSACPLRPHVSSPALISLCSHHSLSLSNSSHNLARSLVRVTSASQRHVPLRCPPAACPSSCRRPPGLSPGPRFPRPSPLDAVLSVALQPVSTARACSVPSQPSPALWELAPCTTTSQPLLHPPLPTAGAGLPWLSVSHPSPLILHFGGPALEAGTTLEEKLPPFCC